MKTLENFTYVVRVASNLRQQILSQSLGLPDRLGKVNPAHIEKAEPRSSEKLPLTARFGCDSGRDRLISLPNSLATRLHEQIQPPEK